jgi:hypothetical protein
MGEGFASTWELLGRRRSTFPFICLSIQCLFCTTTTHTPTTYWSLEKSTGQEEMSHEHFERFFSFSKIFFASARGSRWLFIKARPVAVITNKET